MLKRFLLLVFTLSGISLVSAGPLLLVESDDSGDYATRIKIFRKIPKLDTESGKEFSQRQQELNAFKKEVLQVQPDDFAVLFGEKAGGRPKGIAFPVFESGAVSALQPIPSQGRLKELAGPSAFYEVNDFAVLKVYYEKDSQTPRQVLVYFRMDNDFVELEGWSNLRTRLDYDTGKLQRLLTWFKLQKQAVVN